MYTQEERAYLNTFEPDMGNSGLGNLINMFVLQPWMDNQAVTGLARSNSIWLQKALSNTDEMTSFASRHMFGSRFITGGIEKTPILNKILPKNSKKLGDSILKKFFPNTEFHYNKGFNEQVAEGAVNFSDSGREELLRTTEKMNINKDGELAGKGFTWSNKSDNDLVKKLRKLGVTAGDFRDGNILEEEAVKIKENAKIPKYSKEKIDEFVKNRKKYVKTNSVKAYKKELRRMKNTFDEKEIEKIVKPEKIAKHDKEGLRNLFKKHIIDFSNKTLGMETKFDDLVEHISTVVKEEDFEGVMTKSFNSFSKEEKLTLSGMKTIFEKTTNEEKKIILDNAMNTAKEYAKNNADDVAETLATRITSKTAFQKFFSSGFGKVITQVGTGPLAMGLNVAGMIIGGIASHGQEKAVNNMYKTIFDRGLLERQPVFVPNEATMHSLQTHMQRSENDLEEYKKIYYYRNTSNELRNDISPINGDFLNIENVNTN